MIHGYGAMDHQFIQLETPQDYVSYQDRCQLNGREFHEGVGDINNGLDAGIPCGRQERNQEWRQPETEEHPRKAQTRGFAHDGSQNKRQNQQAGRGDELEEFFQAHSSGSRLSV